MDSHSRSIAKAVSYRLLGTASTMLIFFLFSQDLKLSLGAGALDMLVKIAMYWAHERVWNRVPFVRQVRRAAFWGRMSITSIKMEG
ncbi:MAG: DUF2061 domain-containing protein [Acidobacteriota bacterium]